MELPLRTEDDVSYGSVTEHGPLVRRVVAENPSKFTYRGSGTYLVGRGEVAVIDPGPEDRRHAEAVLAALDPGERITAVCITHTHADHSPGLRDLRALGVDAPAYGFGPHGDVPSDDPADKIVFGDPEADRPADETQGEPMRESVDHGFVPDVVVTTGGAVRGDGWTLEALHTPGHTSNHLCFALVEDATLFTGDHVMGWSTSVIGPPDGELAAYLDSLRLLLDRDDRRYLPTHGPEITEPQELVRAFLAHRASRLDQARSALADGPASLAEIVPVVYAEVGKHLWKAAAASMYAHLLHLVDTGEVVVVDPPVRRTATFALADS